MTRALPGRWPGVRVELPLLLLLVSRLALGIGYSLVVPLWEAYDEDGHFAYVSYLVRYHHLLQPGDPAAEQVWERFQPPLYYLLIAPVAAWFEHGEPFTPPALNANFANGDAGVNYALHPDHLEGPDSRIAQAVYAARLVGVLLTTLSVLFIYLAAKRLWPTQPAAQWAVTSLYAFWPQLLFNGSVITNDLLVAALGAGVLYVSVLLLIDGFRLWRAAALAGLLAMGVLTKINALALMPMALVAVALGLAPSFRYTRRKPFHLWLALLVLVGLIAGAFRLVGSMSLVTSQLLRLQTLYNFAANLAGVTQPTGLGLNSLARALEYGFRTFFASFGWGNLETFAWAYDLWALGAALAVVGLIIRLLRWRRGASSGPGLPLILWMGLQLLIAVGLALALVIAGNSIYLLPGRYLLAVLPEVCVLLVAGWSVLIPRRGQVVAWKMLSVGIILLGWSIPIWTIAPAYAKPLPQTRPPEVAVGARIGQAIVLLGYNRPPPVQPGQAASLSLCWRATAPVKENATVFVEIIGPDGQGYGRLTTYPGHGNYATSLWAVGVPFCDHYAVPVGADFPAPAAAQLRVALLVTTDVNGQRLPVVTADGTVVEDNTVSLPLAVVQTRPPAPLAHTANARFGDVLMLRDYSVTEVPATHAVRVDLRWEALRDLDTDYEIFVHLRDAPDHAYAQGDSEPRAGWYPTSLWRKGETVEDEHVIALPPGATPRLALYVGVVRRDNGDRLPAFDSASVPLADSEVILQDNLFFGSGSAR